MEKSLSQKFVKEKILEKCKKKNYILIEPFIYKNANEKNIHLKCMNDNYEWYCSYYNFINKNQNCSKCSNVAKLEL